MSDRFAEFSNWVAHWSGKPHAFALAVVFLFVWAAFGPFTGYSEQWQLVVNTGTTILTFLMVFIIQNTQNRNTMALHLKLDEVIRAIAGAKNELIDLENLSEAELEQMQERFHDFGERARNLKERASAALEKKRSASTNKSSHAKKPARQRRAKAEA
jgi:low affinity Fe/Cu permease